VFSHLRRPSALTFHQALDYLDPVLRANCLQTLSKICGRQALLPRSLSITVSWDPAEAPLYQGGCADVWRGRARRLTVAIKVPRMYRSDGHEKIRSVSSGSSLGCGLH